MIAGLSLILQIAAAGDSLPRVTLAEVLNRSARLDPRYVAARGNVDNAVWSRRAAWYALTTPQVRLASDLAQFSTPTFVLGADQPQGRSVTARAEAFYEVFGGGRQFAELSRSRAMLEATEAIEVRERFDAELRAESDYYQVLADQELTRVAAERVRRAREQLGVARARVISGAAVSTDSLQLLLELNRARVAELRQISALRVARLQLGRRIGMNGPVDATPLGDARAPDLTLSLAEAVAEAGRSGPAAVGARALEDAAEALVKAERGSYLPSLTLGATTATYDTRFFPDATSRTSFIFSATLPIWNGGQREVLMSQARVQREIARATRLDTERAIARDVTERYEAYTTARATTQLAEEAVLVARENYRVQDTRYRAGATTILDLIEAQTRLTEAEAEFVQSRYATRLALGRFEAELGRRLFNDGARQ
ncbi:MAG TPA: TolC family protein [Gemmatimonadaceae bacterium]|nr:TolC family protein [Gemmatimonadaceae bacterium]